MIIACAAASLSATQQSAAWRMRPCGPDAVVAESPTVARRQLRRALRRAREAKGLTQGQVADTLEWSLSKVNRIESGDVAVSNTDLRALLTILDVKDPTRVNDLVATGRLARQRESSHPHITPAMRQLYEYEREAVTIRCFEPTIVVGLLQTPEYAASILGFWRDLGVLTDEEVSARIDIRERRRRDVLMRDNPPLYKLVLDESVCRRVVGDPETTARQFAHLAQWARDDRVELRILPFKHGSNLSMIGSFMIFDLADEENAVMYTEAPRSDHFVDEPSDLRLHSHLYDLIWARSLSRVNSIELLESEGARLGSA
jgi:transcriptional regulator with XRE-family HTH domain